MEVKTDECEFFKICTNFCKGRAEDTESCSCYGLHKEIKELKELNDKFKKDINLKNDLLAELGCPTIACAKRLQHTLKEQIKNLKKENSELKEQTKNFNDFLKFKKFQDNLEDYRECIKYSVKREEKLGLDELMLLLAECIGDEQIEEETGKYVDDYYKDWDYIQKEFHDLHAKIDELEEKCKKDTIIE